MNIFTITVKLSHITYQLVYPHQPTMEMQLSPIATLGYLSLYYPTHEFYQTQWIWGQFQWPLTVQLHLWAQYLWTLQAMTTMANNPMLIIEDPSNILSTVTPIHNPETTTSPIYLMSHNNQTIIANDQTMLNHIIELT